jgi:hypothetical protein
VVQQQQQQAFQQMTQESMSIYVNLFDSPLSYHQQEGSEGTKEHARIADQGLPIEDYDQLSIGEVSEKMSVLSVDELHKVREHENRRDLVSEFDRQMREINGERIMRLLKARLATK